MLRRSVIAVGLVLLLQAASALAAPPPPPPPPTFPPIDLASTPVGTSVTDTQGVIWTSDISQPTGTGIFDPFLRLDVPGNMGSESGFNTDYGTPADPVGNHKAPLDDKTDIHTHALLFDELQKENGYYVFRLDLQEPIAGDKKYLSLDELKIYAVDPANPLIGTLPDLLAAGGAPVFDMDTGTNRTVFLNSELHPGNGTQDLTVLIPESFLDGNAGKSFYFYTIMGATVGLEADVMADAGFEEWSALQGEAHNVPEPSTVLLFGTGLMGLVATRIRRKK